MNDIKWTTNCFLFYFNEMKFFCLLCDVEMCNLISSVIFWIVLFLWCLFSSMFIYRITMKQSTQATKAFKGKTVKISSWNKIRDILKLTKKFFLHQDHVIAVIFHNNREQWTTNRLPFDDGWHSAEEIYNLRPSHPPWATEWRNHYESFRSDLLIC